MILVDKNKFAVLTTATLCDTPDLHILLLVDEDKGNLMKQVLSLQAAELLRDQLNLAIAQIKQGEIK